MSMFDMELLKGMAVAASKRGYFKTYKYEVLENSQGIFKIRIQTAHTDSYWRDVTDNDIATSIVGHGSIAPVLFFSQKEVDDFIELYWDTDAPARRNFELQLPEILDDFK